jgi:hypothetical protein
MPREVPIYVIDARVIFRNAVFRKVDEKSLKTAPSSKGRRAEMKETASFCGGRSATKA